jgi:PLP dependent protein
MSKASLAPGARVQEALNALRRRISGVCAGCGRTGEDVTVVAVSKGFGPEAIEAAIAANLTDIGENYYQEAVRKFAQVSWPPVPLRRHYIGRVQRKKARRIAELFDWVQTIDGTDTAAAVNSGAQAAGRTLDVLIQINTTGDRRQGVAVEHAGIVAAAVRRHDHLRLRGVMTIGPEDPAGSQGAFSQASACFTQLRELHPSVDTLSMGMSGDLEPALRAGSNMIRIGTGLFGPRPKPPPVEGEE